MSAGLKGWRLDSPDFTQVNYRSPWRTNWVAQLHQFPRLDVAISRSGVAYLLIRREESLPVVRKINKRTNFLIPTLLGLLFATIAIGLPLANPASGPRSVPSGKTPEQHVKALSCEDVFEDSIKHIQQFFQNSQDSNFAVQFGEEQRLGGVSSSIAQVSCGSASKLFRVTMLKIGSDWHVTNSVQLEN